jgi:hypothetical protein
LGRLADSADPLRAVDAVAPALLELGAPGLQLQLGALGQIPNVLGAVGLSYGGEVIYKRVPGLPNPSVTRFGRAEVFGQGPVDGVCAPPAAPVSCTSDGYVSRDALGYRLRAGLRYANVLDGLDLVPSVLFGQDVWGWSGDGLLLEGRMLCRFAAGYTASGWTAPVTWQPTWGGTYSNTRDRSTAQVYVSYQFENARTGSAHIAYRAIPDRGWFIMARASTGPYRLKRGMTVLNFCSGCCCSSCAGHSLLALVLWPIVWVLTLHRIVRSPWKGFRIAAFDRHLPSRVLGSRP